VQPSGENAIFLRRDTTQLLGKGLIGLGQRVRMNDPVAVRYEIL
jgi:hypothetical protein